MLNQKVSITETELKKLKEIRPPLFPSPLKRKGCGRVKFDLPLNDQTISSFQTLVGKAHTRGWKAGVYIFTHKPTGSKYIGSPPSPKKAGEGGVIAYLEDLINILLLNILIKKTLDNYYL